jgi:hypothetical protein
MLRSQSLKDPNPGVPLLSREKLILLQPGVYDLHIGSHDRAATLAFAKGLIPIALIRVSLGCSPVNAHLSSDVAHGKSF